MQESVPTRPAGRPPPQAEKKAVSSIPERPRRKTTGLLRMRAAGFR